MSLFPDNNANMIACAVVVDCSGSMSFEIAPGFTRIQALSAGLDVLAHELKSDPTVRNSVEVAVIDIGGRCPHSATMIQDWTYARDFVPPKLEASGSTPLAEGLLMAIDATTKKKAAYRHEARTYNRPWIILISDGQPTDSDAKWTEAVNAAKHAISGKHALILAVGVDGCPLEKLSALSGDPKRPARPLSSHRFSEFFVWLSASISSTSRSKDSTEQMASTDPWSKG